jgi:hypothetical protein
LCVLGAKISNKVNCCTPDGKIDVFTTSFAFLMLIISSLDRAEGACRELGGGCISGLLGTEIANQHSRPNGYVGSNNVV